MLSKAQEKFVKNLHWLKNRRQSGSFFFEGHKMALDGLADEHLQIAHIYALDTWTQYITDTGHQELLTVVSEKEMKKISALKTPSPVLVVAKQPALVEELESQSGLVAFYLEGMQNPGNMGTILRLADWFGVKYVVASPESVDFFNPKVIQASMSSIFRTQLSVMDLELLAQNKGKAQLWATAMNGTTIQEIDKDLPVILMIGNEGKGLSPNAFEVADQTITIPGHPSKKAESLNAAMAAGILASYF